MSKKKTVKAPLTYNPGKGRPKEHLAYLNWQEMQALKRLNGNNQEQGPKGLPSFPPADARSGSYNSGYGSASRSTPSRAAATPSRTTTTSRTSGPSGNLSAPVRTAPSASAYGRTTTTTRSGGTPSAAPRSISGIGSPSRGVTPSYSRGVTTPSAQRTASGVGSPVDRTVKQAVETRSISSAQKTPALAQDRSKVSGGYKLSDITGTNVPGGKVTGAIQSVKDLGIAGVPGAGNRVGVPSATVTNQYVPKPIPRPGSEGQIGKYKYSGLLSSTPSNAEIADMIREEAAARGIDPSVAKKVAVFEGLNRLTKPEEGWQSKVVKKGKRETSYGPYQLRVGGGLGDKFQKITGLNITDPKSVKAQVQFALDEAAKGGWGPWYGAKAAGLSKKSGLSEAKPIYGGSETRSIPKEKTIGGMKSLGIDVSTARDRTGIAPRTPVMSTADVARSAAYMTNPTDRPYNVRTSPSPDKIRSIVPTGDTSGRTTVPGLISYPDLNRPVPPSVGRSAVVPTVRAKKQITDRLLAEPAYRPYDIRVNAPPAPPIRRKEIYDRILPEQAPVSPKGIKEFYDRIPASVPSGTDTPFGGPVGRIVPTGDTLTRSLSGVGENAPIPRLRPAVQGPPRPIGGMSFTPDLPGEMPRSEYSGYGQFVTPRTGGMSFTPGLPEAMPSAPKPRLRPDVQGPPRPIGGMPSTPNLPPEPTYSQIPTPTSTGILPSQGIVQRGIGALKSFDKAAFDTLNDAASYVKRYSDAQKGFAGGVNKFSGIFNKGVSQSDQEVINATQSALKTGAQKISSLQQSWNNAVEEARRVNPAITETKNEDISRGLKTVNEAEGDKLPSPPTTVPPPVENFDEVNKFKNISMAGGLGMVPYNKPGSIKLGVSAEQSIDKRERDLQKYYEGKLKMTTSQKEAVDDYLDRADKAIKVGQAITGVPIGGAGLTSKAYRKSVEKKINAYIDATPEQKLAMEKSNPEIIRWAAIVGEQTQSPYSDYVDWATSRGLRGPGEISRDSGVYGIPQLGGYGTVESTAGGPTPQAQKTSGRPDIYYMWDLGVNIPSPSDPNYTQYQTYLIDRAASQRAMGWA